MTESELKQKIIDVLVRLKMLRHESLTDTEVEPAIELRTVVEILEDLLEVNQDEKTNRTN